MFAPGIIFLGRNALLLGIPAACAVTAIRKLTAATFGVLVPTWALICVFGASIPLYTALRLTLKYVHQRREAAAMGARLAPTSSNGKWPGNLDLLLEMQKIWKFGYPGDGLGDLMEELGPVANLRVMWADIIFTTCPKHIQIILATDFNNYVKGEQFQYGMSSVLGSGVFNSDGKYYHLLMIYLKFIARMVSLGQSLTLFNPLSSKFRPFFSRDRISHFEIFDRHADVFIRLLKTRMRTGHAIDFQDLMGRFTMDSATEFLFGTCVNSLHARLPFPHNVAFIAPESDASESTDEVAMKFTAAFNESMLHISNRARIGWVWPLVEMWFDRSIQPMKVVSAYIDPIIHDAVEKKKLADSLHAKSDKEDDEVMEGATLLDELLKVTSDLKILKDETLNILLAGKDTTQWTTTVIVYFLAMYPKINNRLREEILQHVGPSRRPTYDDIRDMKFLRAVINETMRLFPSVPFNVRASINATTWPSPNPNQKPIYIPAGTQVPYSVFMMHRRKDLWGPDAEEFDPDRWLDDRLKTYLLSNSFQFLPFNAGPRICLGQQFAYNEMSFIIIRLLQNFSSISLDEDAFPPEARPPPEWALAQGRKAVDKFRPKMHLTMYSEGGMWLKMKEGENV